MSADAAHPAGGAAVNNTVAANSSTDTNLNQSSSSSSGGASAVPKFPVREVGTQATWSLSSCKPGFGVEQLRDGSVETYWQSDGQLPHLVNVQFRRKTTVSDVAVYTDFKLDESYTPSKVSVRCGTNFNDLQEIEVVELNEPAGWVVIPLKDIDERLVRTFMVQIAVISNHQQGRDTHLRQIRVHSPVEERPVTSSDFPSSFSSAETRQFLNIR